MTEFNDYNEKFNFISQSHVYICSTEIWLEKLQGKNKFYRFMEVAIMKLEEYGSDREI
jgi:hypothetical protein